MTAEPAGASCWYFRHHWRRDTSRWPLAW